LLRSGSELSNSKTDRSTLRTSRKASDPPLSVVKSQMMQAYSFAQAAGQAAMRARMAYEKTLGNVRAQSEHVAQEMYDKVKRAARVQATLAWQKRKAFEAASLQAAHEAGATELAAWEGNAKAAAKASSGLAKRAGDYATAAAEREALVSAWAQRVEDAKRIGDKTAEERNLLQLWQAEDQSAELSGLAASIQKEAAQASSAAAFYTSHAAGAAEYALEQALPKGVAIPEPDNPLRFN